MILKTDRPIRDQRTPGCFGVVSAVFGVLTLLTACPGSAQERTGRDFEPGLHIDLDYSYYEVSGSTPLEMYRSLKDAGPEVGGDTFFALTAVETGFRYRHVQEGAICRLNDVGVHARVVMRLPQWQRPLEADLSLGDAWDEFVHDLTRHEAEHYQIIESGARQIYNALLDVHTPSCSGIDARATRVIKEISDAQALANEKLDRDTGHGASEGAVWPRDDFASVP